VRAFAEPDIIFAVPHGEVVAAGIPGCGIIRYFVSMEAET
jgi:hypothetical protein